MVGNVKKPDHAEDIRPLRLASKGPGRAMLGSLAEVEWPARASGGGCAPDADLGFGLGLIAIRTARNVRARFRAHGIPDHRC